MKKALYTGLAFIVLACLSAVPGWAQKGEHGGQSTGASHSKASAHKASHPSSHKSAASAHSNKGGAVRGLERAEEVQSANTKADTERGFTIAPGVEKAEGKTSTATTGTSATQGKGKSQKGTDTKTKK